MYQLQAGFACLAGFPQRLTHLFLCSQLHRQLLLLGKQYRRICQKIHPAKLRRRKRLLGSGRLFTFSLRQQALQFEVYISSPMSCIWHGIWVLLKMKSYSIEIHGRYTTCSLTLQQQSRTFSNILLEKTLKIE